jgi:hypothetical protein
VVSGDSMILHGGHDGNRHLQDTHVFDFTSYTWSPLVTEGPIPSPRDSHVSVIYGKSMFLYGGSTGRRVDKLIYALHCAPIFVCYAHTIVLPSSSVVIYCHNCCFCIIMFVQRHG